MVNTELVQDFVNSRELRPAVEELETPEQLSAWLSRARAARAGRPGDEGGSRGSGARARGAARRALGQGRDRGRPRRPRWRRSTPPRAVPGLELRFDPTCPRVEPTVGGVRGRDRPDPRRGLRRDGRRHLGAHEGVQGRRLPLGVPRHVQEQDARVVLDGELRQPREGERVPAAASALPAHPHH